MEMCQISAAEKDEDVKATLAKQNWVQMWFSG